MAKAASRSYRQCPACGLRAPSAQASCTSCGAELSATPVRESPLPSWAAERPRSGLLRRYRWYALILLTLFVVALAALLQARASAIPHASTRIRMPESAWSGPQGNVHGTRVTSVTPALGAVLWEKPFPTSGAFPPLADELGVYIAFDDERVIAFGADGKQRWSLTVPGDLDSAPVLAGDLLIAALRNGMLIAYDRATGAVRWQSATHTQQIASPAVEEGVIWTSSLPELAAYDAATGDFLWQSERGWDLRVGAISIAGGHVAVAALREAVIFDALSGMRTYYLGIQEPLFVAATESVVLAASERSVVAFNPSARRPWWERARPTWNWLYAYQMAPAPPPPPRRWVLQLTAKPFAPALDADRAYIADARSLRAHSLDTGELVWRREDVVTMAPVSTPAGLLLGTQGGLVLLDPRTGQTTRTPVGPGSPTAVAVAPGRTYMLSDTGLSALGADAR